MLRSFSPSSSSTSSSSSSSSAKRISACVGISVIATTLLFSNVARADNNAAAAQALFEEARTLMANGNYAAACTKLEGSQALDPGPGTEFNLALCYEKSGKTASAWATYLDAATGYKATNRADWEARSRSHAAALAGTLSRVTIVAPSPSPAGLSIERDGKPLLAAEIGTAIPIDPGSHVVLAKATGRADFRSTFDVKAAANQTVTVVFANASTSPSDTTTPAVDSGGGGTSTRKILAFTLAGVGAAGLVLGGVAGLVALNKNDASLKQCPNDGICTSSSGLAQNSSARDWASVSTVALISGAVLLAAGVIVYFTAPKKSAVTTAALHQSPYFVVQW